MPRSFRSVYDVPHRPQPDIRVQPTTNGGVTIAESGPQVDEREPFVDLLLSEGFKALIKLEVLPYVKDVRRILIHKADLTEIERARYVASLATIERLITNTFKRAGEKVPAWLAAQFQ